MMQVAVRAQASAIEGLGAFAAEPIKAGTLVWELSPGLDLVLSAERFERETGAVRAYLERYAYFDPSRSAFVLCIDDARFMNHSATPNVSDTIADRCHALRDIAPGEELTCNYHTLDPRPMRFEPRG